MMEEDIFEWPWPEGAGATHILGKQNELVALISDRMPIFLDTNFWVMAREAAFSESHDPQKISLLGAIRLAIESGLALFPITAYLIEEFSQQSIERLSRTMMLVDRLSLGIALVPNHQLIAIEMEGFNAKVYPDHPPELRPIWTCVASALGFLDMGAASGSTDEMSVALAEKWWMAPPSLMMRMLPPDFFEARSESERIAADLNQQEAIHAKDIDCHATALRNEVAGAASMLEGIAAREFRRMALAAGRPTGPDEMALSMRPGKKVGRMMAAALIHDEHRRAFGSLYVPAMLHAAVRSEARRRLQRNDIFDFRHATAAVPYCRAFFTDRALKKLITSGHVKLDKLYGCSIAATPEGAIAVLGKLTPA